MSFNITHHHLKEKFSIKLYNQEVLCEYLLLQPSIKFDKVRNSPVDIFEIMQDIMDENIPIRYNDARITPGDAIALQNLTSKGKSIMIKSNLPNLEITYA